MGARILQVSDFYAPFIGGAERQVQLLGKELTLRGYQVRVATVWHEGLPAQQNDDGVIIHRIKGLSTSVPWFSKTPQRRYHPPFPDPALTWGLRRLITRWRPDVVHAHGWIAYSCAAALIGLDIPLVLSARDYGYSCAIRTLLHNGKLCSGPGLVKCVECARHSYGTPKALASVAGVFAGSFLMRRKAKATHSVSTFVQHVVRRDFFGAGNGSHRQRGVLIPDVVIPSFLEHHGEKLRTTDVSDKLPSEPFILFVGALQPHKGLSLLLDAYRQLQSPPPLVLIGTVWPETPKELPPGVTMLHNMPHSAVMFAWEHCMFGVAPSVWPDPLPGVVREAMSAGKAMIATRVGGNTDMIVDGETGLLVPPGNVDALVAAMRTLIDDPQLRARLGERGKQSAEAYTAAAVVPRFEALYRQLMP